jgi:hypothetical protein
VDKNLNVRPETLNLLEENIGRALEDTGIGSDFWNRIPVAQEIRARIDKWDCIRLQRFCTSKKNNYQSLQNGRKKSLPFIHWTSD